MSGDPSVGSPDERRRVRVVRSGEGTRAPGPWSALGVTWAVTREHVGSRQVCGGWFAWPADGEPRWRGGFDAECGWYVTAGALDVSWRHAPAPGEARLVRGTFCYVPPGTVIDVRSDAARGLVVFGGASSPADIAVTPDRPTDADGDRSPWIAHVDELASDRDYEPPLDMRWAVTAELGGARALCGARTLNPPRGRIQHHYHDGVEAVIFFLGGFRILSGPDREPIDVGPGDLAYIAPGTLHSYCSIHTDSPAEEVAFYGGIASKDMAATVFVEPRWSS